MAFHVPNEYRLRFGEYATDDSIGNNGVFVVPYVQINFRCIVSNTDHWEHVSVSLPLRCPTWEEMSFIKSVFWDCDDVVMQLHPAKKDYVNNHPYCLHLWRPLRHKIPTPPKWLV